MKQSSAVQAGRAIASTLVQRYAFYPLVIMSALLIASVLIAVILMVQHSFWWLALVITLALWVVPAGGLLTLSFLTYTKLRPRILTASEKREITRFAKDFGIKYAALKGARKSPTTLAGIVVWKFVRGSGKHAAVEAITEPLTDFKDLKKRFTELTYLFE